MRVRRAPLHTVLLTIFFALATCILLAAGCALLLPGTKLEAIWAAYPARRSMLMPYRLWLGPGFLMLAVAMASACIGCFLHRRWGWRLAVAIFAANGLGDAIQLLLGHVLEGGIGVATAGAILFYLTRPGVRNSYALPTAS
jgi:hypothetical protein